MEKNKILSLYVDICNGFSFHSGRRIYFKHLLPEDLSLCETARSEAIEVAISRGVLSEADLLKIQIDNKKWSTQEDKAIEAMEKDYRRLHDSRIKPVSETQLKALRQELVEIEKEWAKLISKKSRLLENSAKSIGEKVFIDKKIILSSYKDRLLSEKAFDESSLDDLSDYEYYNLVSEYRLFEDTFNMQNLSWVAFSDFVQSKIRLSINPMEFYGKPIISLTDYQISLLSLGKKYDTLLTNDDIPESYMNPEGVEDWYYLKRNNAIASEAEKNAAKSMWS